MSDRHPRTRRQVLGLLGASGVGGIAGCNDERVTTDSSTRTSTQSATRVTSHTISFDGGGREAFANALDTLAETPGATLLLEDKTYRFDPPEEPPPKPFFQPHNLRDVTIDGNGATIMFTDPSRGGFNFLGGAGITIRNLTLDYDPLPFSQGTIVDLSADKRRIIVEIDEGYPTLTHEMFEVAQHASATIHTGDGEYISGIHQRGDPFKRFADSRHLGGRRYELLLSDQPGQNTHGLKVGRKLARAARGGAGIAHCIWYLNVDQPVLENLTIRTTPGMAVNTDLCMAPQIRNVTVAPPPDSNRLIGSVADGIHVSNADSGPTISGCHLEKVGDDGIVVNTDMTAVTRVLDDRTIALDRGGGMFVEQEDILEGVATNGTRIDPLPPVTDIEFRQHNHASYVPSWPARLTFEEPIARRLKAGHYLSNRATIGRGFAVQNNVVRDCIGNSVRLAAGHGVVERNELDGNALHGIWFRCDTSGNTAPTRWSNDVEIRENRIIRSGLALFAASNTAGIHTVHKTPNGVASVGRPHRRLSIDENEIANSAYLGVDLWHARGLEIRKNRLSDLNQMVYRDGGGFGVGFSDVGDVMANRNHVSGSEARLYQFGRQRASDEVEADGNTLAIDGDARKAHIIKWVPLNLVFDRTIEAGGGDRYLGFRCERLSLLDETGSSVITVEVGGRELPIDFGAGVYTVDQTEEGSWRWFGGPEKNATIYVPDAALVEATQLQLRGSAADSGLAAGLHVNGQETDSIRFDSTGTETFALSLEPA